MISVLRLNHRTFRDKRITTHCGLVARAFGADEFILSGDEDLEVLNSLNKSVETWGGPFGVFYEKNWKSWLNNKKKGGAVVVHLTMYGLELGKALKKVKARSDDLVLVIGSAKVPPSVYELADFNVSVGNQPHSEVAALSVFLHDFFEGKELKKEFTGGKLSVTSSNKFKKVIERDRLSE